MIGSARCPFTKFSALPRVLSCLEGFLNQCFRLDGIRSSVNMQSIARGDVLVSSGILATVCGCRKTELGMFKHTCGPVAHLSSMKKPFGRRLVEHVCMPAGCWIAVHGLYHVA